MPELRAALRLIGFAAGAGVHVGWAEYSRVGLPPTFVTLAATSACLWAVS